MTTKELKRLYYLNREIERDKARLEELRSKAAGSTLKITGMPHSPGIADKTGIYGSLIADLQEAIEAKIERCFSELSRLNRFIDSIDDPQIRLILSLRFINGLSWRQVAMSIGGNTEDSVRMICKRFLKNNERGNNK